jgi:arabinofuranosyltransferase
MATATTETPAGSADRRARRRPNPRWAALALALPAAFYAVFIARSPFTFEGRTYFSLFDDAMISMRYGRNLAEGHGLVWNPGERVEGYSNFLWTLWMAVVHLFGLSDAKASLVVMIAGAVLLLLTAYVSGRICEALAPGRRAARFVVVVLVALFYPLVFWSLRGMEVGFAALLIAVGVLLALELAGGWDVRRGCMLAATLAAAVLTRDDLLLPAGLIVAFVLWRLPSSARRSGLLLLGGTLALTVAAHTAFRIAYYGSALPNTYYLKLQGIGLGTRLGRGLTAIGYTWLTELYAPLLLGAAYLVARRRSLPTGAWLLGALFLAQCAYSVYVGGDAFEDLRWANRYISAVVPLLLVLAALGIDELLRVSNRRLALATGAGIAACGLLQLKDWLPTHLIGFDRSPGLNALRPATAWVCAAVLVAAVASLRRWPRARFGLAVWAVGAAVLLAVNALPARDWVRTGAADLPFEEVGAKVGLILQQTTPPGASVAMTAAGNTAYFARRPAIDLLGKMDPVIARSAPKPIVFRPGHDKWDYAHSVGVLRPAVITQLWHPTRKDLCDLRAWGYEKVGPQMFVQPAALGASRTAELGRRIVALGFLASVAPPASCPASGAP